MREIKFRAWNKELGEMWVGGYVQFEPDVTSVENEDGDQFEYTQDEFPLMQYTGLKDKNSKKIYEGDIVHHLRYGDNWEVIWNVDACRFSLQGKGASLMHLTRLCEPNIEVIGNICENQKLLEAQ